MNRRRFLAAISSALAAPLAAAAQPAGKVWRIGYLTPIEVPQGALDRGVARAGLRRRPELRHRASRPEWKYERLPGLAAELVRPRVDVIVAAPRPPPKRPSRRPARSRSSSRVGRSCGRGVRGQPGPARRQPHRAPPRSPRSWLESSSRCSEGRRPGHPGGRSPEPRSPAGPTPRGVRQAEDAARALGLHLQILKASPSEIEAAFAAMSASARAASWSCGTRSSVRRRPTSWPSRPRAGSPRCMGSGSRPRPVASWRTEPACPSSSGAPPPMWTGSSRAPSPQTFPSSSPPSSSW